MVIFLWIVIGSIVVIGLRGSPSETVQLMKASTMVLTPQGKDASGGTKSYIVNGKMTEGFAFVAYPAEYRSSGVMTFIVNQDGVVYQKDLGKETEALGKAMQEYNPDPTRRRAEDEPAQTSSMRKLSNFR